MKANRDYNVMVRGKSVLYSAWNFFTRPLPLGYVDVDAVEDPIAGHRRRQQAEAAAVERMASQLDGLLSQHPKSRAIFRHLVVLEDVLAGCGAAGLKQLPPEVVRSALRDLETLVWDWSAAGLADLRSRLGVLVKELDADPVADSLPTEGQLRAFIGSDSPEISEVDHGDFEECERSWRGQAPGG